MLQIIWYFELNSFKLMSFDCIQKCSTLYTGQPEIVTLFSLIFTTLKDVSKQTLQILTESLYSVPHIKCMHNGVF